MTSNYNKFKDKAPQDTIFEIQECLNRAGLFPVLRWMENSFHGARSNRITLYPTQLGTNGKGTDELYSAASGYAELMERIQNNALALRMPRQRVFQHGPYRTFPDEKYMSIEELISQNDPFLHHLFEALGYTIPFSQNLLLRKFAQYYHYLTDGNILTVPYVDIMEEKIVYLPSELVFNVCGSNGMAAGNTMEEAMVQAMSELYERYVNTLILKGEAVPPEIPPEELKKFSIWNLIEEIEASGRFHVSIRDCSLGKGLPVAAAVISDRLRGTFGVKLGSHPSIAVSVERTLTEALQGKNIEFMTGCCDIGTLQQSTAYHNIPNIAKVGVGVYPASFLSGRPTSEYRPWTEWEGLDNRQFLQRMLQMARRDGLRLLVRDNSHMGFCSVQIVVPGYSDMYPVNELWIKGFNSLSGFSEIFSHFPDITDQEARKMLNLIQFKEPSYIENTISSMSQRPVSEGVLSCDRLAAFIALKLEDYHCAVWFFHKLIQSDPNQKDAGYYTALKQYARSRLAGLDREEAWHLVGELFPAETASRVRDNTQNTADLLKNHFPKLKCFDCTSCEWNGHGCENLEEEKILIRIKDAMKDSTVSQEDLLNHLKTLKLEEKPL